MSFREGGSRFFSGSKTVFLFAFCLSIRAAFPEGIQSGSHWCHSSANLLDMNTKGPHVALRKLSVRQSAAAMTSLVVFF